MRKQFSVFLLLIGTALWSCNRQQQPTKTIDPAAQQRADSLERVRQAEEAERTRPRTADDIQLDTALSYKEHTLAEEYPYQDTLRRFQMDKIKEKLAFIENFQRTPASYAILQNRNNSNGEAPLVKEFHRNEYTLVSDSLGTERYQAAPLYAVGDMESPTIYGRDGWLVKLRSSDTLDRVQIEGVSF